MKVLVTGGAGFIGSHTCVELLESGYEIVVVDNFINSSQETVDKIKEITGRDFAFYEGDIQNEELLKRIFEEHMIRAVIHFAGIKSVNESIINSLEYYNINVMGSLVLLKIMELYNVKRIVFSSSATVYGAPESVPISEDFPANPINPYGRTKIFTEKILEDLYNSDKTWSIAILRYFNPIGSHSSGLIGDNPTGIPNNLVPYIARVAIGEIDHLNIYGDDYNTRDGTGVRDYIHVVDLSVGHVRALEKVLDASGIDTYNLGSGVGYTVFEVIQSFERASGKKIKYCISNRREGDVAESYAQTKKAEQLLGWTAIRDLNQMCMDTWRYVILKQEKIAVQKL